MSREIGASGCILAVEVTSDCQVHFDEAFKLAFDVMPGGKATRFTACGELHLEWKENVGSLLPFQMDKEAARLFAWHWLLAQPDEAFGDDDDMGGEGSHVRGFTIISNYDGVRIKPVWTYYGK